MKSPANVAVFVSGSGTNLQALLDHFNTRGSAVATVRLVVASRPGIGALGRATVAGVECFVQEPRGEANALTDSLLEILESRQIDVIVLAGYLRLVPPEIVARYEGAMLNIHPALLPAFGGAGMYGAKVHEAVIASGARVSGATVHLVTNRYDEGRIVAQWPVPVLPGDTPAELASRVLRVEHMLLPAAVESLVRRYENRLAADQGRGDHDDAGLVAPEQPGAAPSLPTVRLPNWSFELVEGVAPTEMSLYRLNN